MDPGKIKNILEACLLVAGREMTVPQLEVLFDVDDDNDARPARKEIADALVELQAEYVGRGVELVEVASGWRLQSRADMEPWVSRLFQEKSPRYSRALLETLVLVAYRQPITRGEIEDVRGVAVSSSIIKTLQEREWVREVGHKDVPGKPALLGTTRQFLDYFNLKRLEDLPTLGELKDLDGIDAALAASGIGDVGEAATGDAANDAGEDGNAGEEVREAAGPDEDGVRPAGDAHASTGNGSARLELPDMHEVDLEPFRDTTAEASASMAETMQSDADEVDVAEFGNVAGSTADPRADDGIDDSTTADRVDGIGTTGGLSSATDVESLSTAVDNESESGGPEVRDASVADEAQMNSHGSFRQEPSAAEATASELSTAVDNGSGASDDEPEMSETGSDAEPPADSPVEPYEDPQARLKRVIDRFASDQRDDLRAQGRPVVPTLPSDELRDPESESIEAEAPDRDDRVP